VNHFIKAEQEFVFKNQVQETVELLESLLDQDLLGVYLYGSATHKGVQKYSDIDLFALTKRGLTKQEQRVFIEKMLQISKDPKKGGRFPIELTLVEESQVKPWHYPPKFSFQFGEWMRSEFEAKKEQIWSSAEMPDLAVLITLVRLSGIPIKGLSPKDALPQVPYLDFMRALKESTPFLVSEIYTDTRNVLLTLARIWATFCTDTIGSKTDSAEWAIAHLPIDFIEPMERARKIALGAHPDDFTDLKNRLRPLVDFIQGAIDSKYESLQTEHPGDRKVTLKF